MSKKKASKKAKKRISKDLQLEWRPRIGFFADVDQLSPSPPLNGVNTYAVGFNSYLFDEEALECDVVATN